MADISIIHDGDNNVDYNIKDAIGRANCSTGLQNLEDCIISILPESAIDDTPPISFLSNGDPLPSVVLSGNGQQTGTPTPDNPVMPDFVGVRTRNLAWAEWAQDFVSRIDNSNRASIVTDDGRECLQYQVSAGYGQYDTKYIFKIEWEENTRYTISFYGRRPVGMTAATVARLYYTDDTYENINVPSAGVGNYIQYTVTSASGKTVKSLCAHYSSGSFIIDINTFMVNEGSTALPYEPFGYKIPISCGAETIPVYLGQVQTVRRVKKLVLTGEEAWSYSPISVVHQFSAPLYSTANRNFAFSTHYKNEISNTDGVFYHTSNLNSMQVFFVDERFDDAADFKSYLAAQYTAGTPVTVWYVLAEPETAIVNEPLCKIGDYADELHSTDSGITIPTAKGQNTLTVETDLQPSGIKVTGNIVGTGETESHIVTDNVDIPTDIPSNSDLDTYTTDGVYRITDIFIAATILNAPVTNVKYILEVFSVSDTDTIQRITTESDIYTRQKSSGVWGSWYKFTGTEVST